MRVNIAVYVVGLLTVCGCEKSTRGTTSDARAVPLAARSDGAPASAAAPDARPAPVAVTIASLCDDVVGALRRKEWAVCTAADLQRDSTVAAMARASIALGNLCLQSYSDLEAERYSIDAGKAQACAQAALAAAKPDVRHEDGADLADIPAYLGVIVGKQAEGQPCFSALECQEGLWCKDGLLHVEGKCSRPLSSGRECPQVAPELLGALGVLHPVCQGGEVCRRGACYAPKQAGEDCYRRDEEACARGLVCLGGKCAPPALVGARCISGDCATGLFCDGGTCRERRPAGQPCTEADECRGTCQKGFCVAECGST